MSKYNKLLVGGAAVLALLMAGVQPASANVTGSIEFVVEVTTPPLGYPGASAPGAGTITVSTSTCVDAVAQDKAPKAPATAGPCDLSGGGTIGPNEAGVGAHCGASGGTVTITYIASDSQPYTIAANFDTAGSVFAFEGTITKNSTGKTGKIAGAGDAVPSGGSCANGTATVFTVAGSADFAIIN